MCNSNNHDVLVIDNIINTLEQENLKAHVYNDNFNWKYLPQIITPVEEDKNKKFFVDGYIKKGTNPSQFYSPVLQNDKVTFDFVFPIFQSLITLLKSNIEITRIKFNLLTNSKNKRHHWPHSDTDCYDKRTFTALYYVCDSDGPTYIFNEFIPIKNYKTTLFKTIEPKQGRLVLFDAKRLHASSSPNKHDFRSVLNIVFKTS